MFCKLARDFFLKTKTKKKDFFSRERVTENGGEEEKGVFWSYGRTI